jgi:aerobic-type carbon monoxide dehydrogenase small subunit (CoxS/CutS family)
VVRCMMYISTVNVCRCGTYFRIRESIKQAARR